VRVNPTSFAALVAAAVGGDEQAFAVLWRAHNPRLLRYLAVLAPGWAQELAADTWLELTRSLARFEGEEAGFRALLFTIARRRALDWRRRETRRPAVPMPPEWLPDQPAADDPAAATLEGLSTRAALGLLAQLPRAQAEVLVLRVVAGLDVAEVARVVGKRPGAVRMLAHRGLRRLAAQLATAGLPVEV
jgi:RNA polymerase sigma-70 factor, ECF subfamily